MTLACEDANSMYTCILVYLLRLFCFADVGAEKRVDESLVQTWKLKFGHKVDFFVQPLKS